MNASTAQRAGDAFGALIAPVSTATFFERYFEHDVLDAARGDTALLR